MTQAGRDPRAVAAALLNDRRMIEACASHDMQTIIKLMRSRGASVNGMARAADLSAGRLYEYETGERRPSGFQVFQRISDGFGIPGRYLALADRPWEQEASAETAPPVPDGLEKWVASRTVEAMSHFTRMDLMLDRRDATTKAIAGLTIGAPLMELVEHWLSPEHERPERRPPGNIGLADVERIEQVERMFREWSERSGGGLRRKAVVGQLNDVADLLRDSHPAEITRRLFRVMAYLADTTAFMCADSSRAEMAQQYHILALRASKEAGDRAFGAKVLVSMADNLLRATGPGNSGARPADALELIRLAGEGAKGEATPAFWALMRSSEARAYAKLGRVQAFRRATGQAEDASANTECSKEPHWLQFQTDAELAGCSGHSLLILAGGHPDQPAYAREAASIHERAVHQHPAENLRIISIDQAGLAESYFMQGELEAAVSAGHQSIDLAAQTHSDRVRDRLSDLYRLTVRYKREPVVHEFSDRLAGWLTGENN